MRSRLITVAAFALMGLALPGCTLKIETCPEDQKCAPNIVVNAEFCGEIVVGGVITPVRCPADASADH